MKLLAKCACSKPNNKRHNRGGLTQSALYCQLSLIPQASLLIINNKFSHFAVGFSPFLSTILIALRAIWQIDTFENMHSLALLARAYR